MGGLPESTKAQIFNQSPNLIPAVADWDREIAFSHYIQEKLIGLVSHLSGGKIQNHERDWNSRKSVSLKDDIEDQIASTVNEDDVGIGPSIGTGKKKSGARRASAPELETVIGRDGKFYVMINQMVALVRESSGVEISADQIRHLVKKGVVPAVKFNDIMHTDLPPRENAWLFEHTDDNRKLIISILGDIECQQRSMSKTKAAAFLECSEKSMSRYEKKGLITSHTIQGHIYYSIEDLVRLYNQLPLKVGRPPSTTH